MKELLKSYRLYLAWILAVIALCGSLFFSEVMLFEPCKLCWFQRICMYPLAALLGLAAYKNDKGIIPYARILSIVGMGFSLFHYLEQKVPGMAKVLPCTVGVPCSGQYINWLGFITIPFLALVAFALITILLFVRESTQA
ncbi:disulfide oxidoreductase [Paenibacillus whitsoniae]|uniref:Disulfide bond formation protein B n=1 Tax=Paenibacillus whitsoniae TaxID=2496558 RepID=A0A3S0CCS7_9BACL|nr:disulfide oxidoreductase [Paenibacillus whitsoniae]RTE10990.1 disulfide bond formation protein B [Paenibacillus whitsoniae]